jgi:hypothetical protein
LRDVNRKARLCQQSESRRIRHGFFVALRQFLTSGQNIFIIQTVLGSQGRETSASAPYLGMCFGGSHRDRDK